MLQHFKPKHFNSRHFAARHLASTSLVEEVFVHEATSTTRGGKTIITKLEFIDPIKDYIEQDNDFFIFMQ